MKMKFYTLFLLTLSMTCAVQAQETTEATQAELSKREAKKDAADSETAQDYRRTSLCLVMAEDTKVENSNIIRDGFLNAAMPDKYNDHNVGERVFQMEAIALTEADKALFLESVERGKKSEKDAMTSAQSIETVSAQPEGEGEGGKKKKKGGGGFGKFAGGLMAAASTNAEGEQTNDAAGLFSSGDEAAKAYKYLCDNKMAYLVANKWFAPDSLGMATTTLVEQRGLYDATASQVDEASNTQLGLDVLKNAGEGLIDKSFVIVSEYNYLSKDELVAQIDAAALLVASQIKNQYAVLAAKAATTAIKASLGAGYYVQTKSHLFQFEFNEESSNYIYSELWDKPVTSWAENADKFKLNYIGSENAWANVKAGIFTTKSNEELIYGATINAMDNVLAKMNKKYEVFKSKTPLIVTQQEDGKMKLTAKIGLKEGLSGGDKFEVLEASIDKDTKKTTYKRVGIIKVSKDQIWDNRFGADEEREITKTTQDFEETLFEGGKAKFYSGLLIKQLK